MTRSTTTQHRLVAAVLVACTAGCLGAGPALAEGLIFTGAGFVESDRGNFSYGHSIAADERKVTGVVVVRYAIPNRDGLDTVITNVRDVEIEREGEVVACGQSRVTFPDGSFEARVPTMVHVTAFEYGLIYILSDGRIIASVGSVVLGGNSPPAPLPPGPLGLVAGVSMGSATDDTFAIGAAVKDEGRNAAARKRVEGPAYGQFAAKSVVDGRVVYVDGAPLGGEVEFAQNEPAEFKVSGPAIVDTTDGSCVGEWQLAVESGLAILDVRTDCAAGSAKQSGWTGWSAFYRSF